MDTGATLNRIRNKIATLHAQRGRDTAVPECVGVVLYGYYPNASFKFSDGYAVPVVARE